MKILEYDGTFELDFLTETEGVRSAGKNKGGKIEIINRYTEQVILEVSVGQTIERLEDGRLRIRDDEWPEVIYATHT